MCWGEDLFLKYPEHWRKQASRSSKLVLFNTVAVTARDWAALSTDARRTMTKVAHRSLRPSFAPSFGENLVLALNSQQRSPSINDTTIAIRSRNQRIPSSSNSTLKFFLPTSTLDSLPSSTLMAHSTGFLFLRRLLSPFTISVFTATRRGRARSNHSASGVLCRLRDAASGDWVVAADGRRRSGCGGVGCHGAELGDAMGLGLRGFACGICVSNNAIPADRSPKGTNFEKESF